MIKNKFIKRLAIVFMALILTLVITGCSKEQNRDEYSDMILVIYDGNGGFLGNKTSLTRKLKVEQNSKIPKYVQELENNPYVVSSLGVATREGFKLNGWYLPENATYEEKENGSFVKLDVEAQNGVYNINEAGVYVEKYIEEENGQYVLIHVGEAPKDVTEFEYIYYQGPEGYGFYVYDPDNADHASIYELNGGYKPSEVSEFGKSYLKFDNLTDEQKTLFADVERFNKGFYPYQENDKGLDRYNLEDGYADYDSMFEENNSGLYVNIDDQYKLFDEENLEHAELQRYSINPKYKFTPSEEVPTPSELKRYAATITYWDFEKDRVTKEITLYAHWTRKVTVQYVQKSGQVNNFTTKLSPDRTKDIPLVRGETIGKPEAIPLFVDHTFVGWSRSETEYIPWNFETDVFPVDSDILKLYAYMVKGTYKRITSAQELAEVYKKPEGKYLLCNDIDLKGEVFNNKSPLGLTAPTNIGATPTVFTGEFLSVGHKISNFTLKVANSQKSINAGLGIVAVTGLFPYVQNAKIEGLIVENATVHINNNASGSSVVCDLGGSGLVGIALEGNTIVNNVQVNVKFTKETSNVLTKTVYVGDVVGSGTLNTTISNATAEIDYSEIVGITNGTFEVHTLK